MATPETLNGISSSPVRNNTNDAATFFGSTGMSNSTVADRVNENRTIATTIKQYSFIENPKYHLYITAEDYTRQSAMQLATGNITDQIILPIPAQMIDNHKVEYSQEALGPLGATAINGLGAAMGAARNPSNLLNTFQSGSALYGSAQSIALGGAGLAASMGYDDLARRFNPMVTNTIRSIAGVAQNQFMVILLKGPTYKKFTFEWHLSPKNKQQTENLSAMIKMLNNAMAPDTALGGYFFTFPKIFRIQFRPNDQYMYRFKPAVLENFTVNYTGSGMPAFYTSGGPESYKLSMHFMEMEFWTKGQF